MNEFKVHDGAKRKSSPRRKRKWRRGDGETNSNWSSTNTHKHASTNKKQRQTAWAILTNGEREGAQKRELAENRVSEVGTKAEERAREKHNTP